MSESDAELHRRGAGALVERDDSSLEHVYKTLCPITPEPN